MKKAICVIVASIATLALIGMSCAMDMSPNDSAFGNGGSDPGFTPGDNSAANNINDAFPSIIGGDYGNDDSVVDDGFDTSDGGW